MTLSGDIGYNTTSFKIKDFAFLELGFALLIVFAVFNLIFGTNVYGTTELSLVGSEIDRGSFPTTVKSFNESQSYRSNSEYKISAK